MAQRRAKIGGEFGANGEWYEGGKWIATTDHGKKYGSVKATKKQEIEPFVWRVPPDGMRSIYAKYSGVWERTSDGKMKCRSLPVEYWGADYLAEAQAMAERWNSGERWITA